MQRAMARLKLIVPITIDIIFLLLYVSFNSFRYATMIMLNLPLALIGGIVGLWVRGKYLSVPASVGFINLFGVAVLNGLVLLSYIDQLKNNAPSAEEAVVRSCMLRLRPILMTATVALFALTPLALATGVAPRTRESPRFIVCTINLISRRFRVSADRHTHITLKGKD
jgi:cobalt-zinc-cadmium resistance protein CzcA